MSTYCNDSLVDFRPTILAHREAAWLGIESRPDPRPPAGKLIPSLSHSGRYSRLLMTFWLLSRLSTHNKLGFDSQLLNKEAQNVPEEEKINIVVRVTDHS